MTSASTIHVHSQSLAQTGFRQSKIRLVGFHVKTRVLNSAPSTTVGVLVKVGGAEDEETQLNPSNVLGHADENPEPQDANKCIQKKPDENQDKNEYRKKRRIKRETERKRKRKTTMRSVGLYPPAGRGRKHLRILPASL